MNQTVAVRGSIADICLYASSYSPKSAKEEHVNVSTILMQSPGFELHLFQGHWSARDTHMCPLQQTLLQVL